MKPENCVLSGYIDSLSEDIAMSKPSAGIRALIWFSVFAKFTKLVKLAKFVKLAKPLITIVSMSISAIVYAFLAWSVVFYWSGYNAFHSRDGACGSDEGTWL